MTLITRPRTASTSDRRTGRAAAPAAPERAEPPAGDAVAAAASCAASVCADRARWQIAVPVLRSARSVRSMPAVASARRLWILIVLLVAIAVGVVWYLRRGTSSAASGAATGAPAGEPATARTAAATGVGHSIEAAASQDAASAAPRSDARAKRDALREQILRQLAQRPAAPSGGTPAAGSSTDPSSDPPSGGLRNRLDERHQAVVDQLNRDFMPLAKECVDQAQQRTQITGLIALSMETVADEQLGAVVDAAEPAPSNQVVDPLLFECLRESAFSLSLPPPPTGGRMKALITLRMDDSPSGSGGSGGSGSPGAGRRP
jgi:hypothetical protein